MLSYKIIRTKRRTAAIYIRSDGAVEIRVPLRMPIGEIERFAEDKRDWIEEKSEKMLQACRRRSSFTFSAGDTLTYLGNIYPIRLGNESAFDGQFFTVPDEPFEVQKPKIVALYRLMADRVLRERVNFYAEKTGLKASKVRIGSAKTCWGSCSGRNSLSFTWRLVMAPIPVIDYVVVHELAHTREHNHSVRFWSLVESILPDFRQRRANLKSLQEKLLNENWN